MIMAPNWCRFKYPDGLTYQCLCHSRLKERFWSLEQCGFIEYDALIPKDALTEFPSTFWEIRQEMPVMVRVPVQLELDFKPSRLKRGEYHPHRARRPHRRAKLAWLLRLRGLTYKQVGNKLGCSATRATQLVYSYSGYLNHRMEVRHVKWHFIKED